MRPMFLKRLGVLILFVITFVSCEGHFAGERDYNIQILNGTYEMKMVTLSSTQYLAILNTNYQFHASTGSIQFYSLTNPLVPALQSDMSVEVPSNVGDYAFDGATFFVADRNENQILIFDFANGKF